ncbi:MAG: hypothetical protein KJP08_04180 [Gammaproteobacteria bacterium]|nr:hypothetical protein [Gammaproteobacteria bacterium]NNF49699.1 hypothetical protein [Woeseiaceae bacterium]MBT8093984.1 hypothetical protein [Gammaproteobacteria bacterium]MBT8105281.1 hypothetical protein [Gammaproteobacteria bacterium]NNK25295.1 hypothetical protein [Woeseiaceae bacterium]
MAFDSTMTEFEMDPGTQQFIQRLRSDNDNFEPDLAVDGLTNGLLARLIRLFYWVRN